MSPHTHPEPDRAIEANARARQLTLTKPPGSLGRLEDLACWLAARLHDPVPESLPAEIFVFAADHGVAAQGVSAFPQAVTGQMVRNFARGGAAINVLASLSDCRIEVVDVGVASSAPTPPGVRNERVRAGTADLSQGPAMNDQELEAALAVGDRCAAEAAQRGARLLIAGDMGIANTTAAACLVCAYSGAPPPDIVGRGTGVSDEGLALKRAVVARAVRRVGPECAGRGLPRGAPARRVLAELGGLEIAAITGCYLGAARRGIPVLLDGFISAAAALAATAIEPSSREWLLASHRSAETGHGRALEALGLTPLIDLGMRLGEGSGAALVLPILRAALALHSRMATFAAAGVSDGGA